jgi:hypothetical protein
VAAPVQRTPGRRPLPVAVDTHKLRRCLRRTSAIQTPTFWTPTFWTRTVVPGAAADSPRRPRCPVPQPPRHRPRCPAGAGRRRTRSRRCGATAGPGSRICSSALVKLPGRRSQRNGCPDAWTRTRPAEHREPARPALRTPATAAGHGGHCGSGHAGQPAAGPFTTPQRRPTGTEPQCAAPPARPADRQIRRLVLYVGLVGSSRIWPAHVGGLVGPDGSRRILSDRLDDQTDDQAVRCGALGRSDHRHRRGPGTRYSIW